MIVPESLDALELQSKRTELHASTDALNVKLEEVEKAFVQLGLGVPAQVLLSADGNKCRLLRFGKLDNRWRLLFVDLDDTTSPLVNASRAWRMTSVQHFPALLAALSAALTKEIIEVKQRSDDLDRFVKLVAEVQRKV